MNLQHSPSQSKLAIVQQVRDLEQQLNQSNKQRQSSILTREDELLGVKSLQTNPPQDRNLSYIRAIEKEKREALEVRVL